MVYGLRRSSPHSHSGIAHVCCRFCKRWQPCVQELACFRALAVNEAAAAQRRKAAAGDAAAGQARREVGIPAPSLTALPTCSAHLGCSAVGAAAATVSGPGTASGAALMFLGPTSYKATLARLTKSLKERSSSRSDHHAVLMLERAACHPDRSMLLP